MKTCTKCGIEKPLSGFRRGSSKAGFKNGIRSWCKQCEISSQRKRESYRKARRRYERSPLGRRRQLGLRLKHLHGLTIEEYELWVSAQNGMCAICMKPPGRHRLSIDHNHVTGKIRGLLCGKCNTALGLLGENPATIFRAVEYLRIHSE